MERALGIWGGEGDILKTIIQNQEYNRVYAFDPASFTERGTLLEASGVMILRGWILP